MAVPSSTASLMLLLLVLMLCLAPRTLAFGAGEIPDVSAMAKIAYRHGTIENVLENIAKTASSSGPGAGRLIAGVAGAFLTGNAGSLADALSSRGGGDKFTGLDIKRVYFGNWLRDYSQAMDIAGLSKLSGDSIVLVIMCLGFMAFGYATEEFEVTKEKLGVYLCTEHIDNPKGYSSDAQRYDMRLRPPVKDEELEIDPKNGMKKYIATEGRGFDTSTYCIRMHLRKCIELGRNGGEKERYEAYRELGTALHTLEDFLAHSNYLELALNKMGHRNVFCHVGYNVRVRAPNGQNVPPIVTGTFGGSDFLVSVMGEVGDKLSSATVNDLNAKFDDAKTQKDQKGNGVELIKALMSKIGGGGGGSDGQNVEQDLENVEKIRKNAVHINPDQLASKEVQKIFVDVLRTRDNIFKNIEHTLEQLGLDDYIDELTNALSILVLTTIEPYVAPIIKTVTEGLTAGSGAILQQEDQLLVFNDDDASDPTHSVLSKDHFDLWLNEPAGLVAIEVVKHTVPLIVQAWGDQSLNADQVIDVVLQALHHPYFARDDSEIQRTMLETVRSWLDSMDSSKRNKVINSLSKESVKNGNNKREESESYGTLGHRCSPGHSHHGAGGHGHNQLATGNRLAGNPVPNHFGEANDDPYGQSHGRGQGMGIASGFGAMQQSIGGRMEERYGRQQDHNEHQDYSSGRTEHSYGQSTQHEPFYGGHADSRSQYGQQTPFGGGRDDHDSYGQGRHEESHQRRDDHEDHGYSGRYGSHDEQDHSYGRSEHARYEDRGHEESHRSNSEYNSSAYGDNDRHGVPTYKRHEDSEEPRRRYGDDENRHEEFGGRRDDYSRNQEHEGRDEYGQPSYGHHERDHEERRAETRYGGEDMGSRFGAMNLGGDRRNEDYGENHQHDRSEDHGYGGRRYRDDDDEHGPHRHGGHHGDDHEGDERHEYRGGEYGHQEYRHDDGEAQNNKNKDKKKEKEKEKLKKKEFDSDSDDNRGKSDKKYKQKQSDGDESDAEKRYKKELKKAQKKDKKAYKGNKDSTTDDSDDSDRDSEGKKEKKYGKKFYY